MRDTEVRPLLPADELPQFVVACRFTLGREPEMAELRSLIHELWYPTYCHALPPSLRLFHFDTAYHEGAEIAAGCLSYALRQEEPRSRVDAQMLLALERAFTSSERLLEVEHRYLSAMTAATLLRAIKPSAASPGRRGAGQSTWWQRVCSIPGRLRAIKEFRRQIHKLRAAAAERGLT